MSLTKKEQETFENMFSELMDTSSDVLFVSKVADVLFEMTGNVNLRMRFVAIAHKLSKGK